MNFDHFSHAVKFYHHQLVDAGKQKHTKRWQGEVIEDRLEAEMRCLTLQSAIIDTKGETDLAYYRREIQPNLPWADDHFLERVQGEPLNPGEQWAKWPWGNSANAFRDEHGMFNHNYMERYWPKYAGQTDKGEIYYEGSSGPLISEDMQPNQGIRKPFGDLDDLVELLTKEPDTRQAVFPVYYPEDVGYCPGERRPCSLTYNFNLDYPALDVVYSMRSCDFTRHFRDDLYLTMRLVLWVIQECQGKNPEVWNSVVPGKMKVDITDLHVFINDWYKMREAKKNGTFYLP